MVHCRGVEPGSRVLRHVVAGSLSSVDVENFPGYKSCAIEVEHRVDDVGYSSHSAHRVKCCQRLMRLRRVHRCTKVGAANRLHHFVV